MASLARVLNDYVDNLRAIQVSAQLFAQLPTGVYDSTAAISQALSDTRAQRDALLVGLSTAPLWTDRDRENLGLLITAAYDSTEGVTRDPRGDGAMGGFGQFWQEIRPFVKHVTQVLIGLAGVAAGTWVVTKFVLPQIVDPTGIKAKVDVFFSMREACAKMMESCQSDPEPTECIKAARRWCKEVEESAANINGGCGLFNTPYGTLIGGLIGVGLGWSGMRRIMGW